MPASEIAYLCRESANAQAAVLRTRRALRESAGEALRPAYLVRAHPAAVTVAAIGAIGVAAGVALHRFRRPRSDEACERRVVVHREGKGLLSGMARTIFGLLLSRFLAPLTGDPTSMAAAGSPIGSE